MEEKEYYIRMCIKNNYSARELNRQLSSGYFYRYMLSKDNNALESTAKTIDVKVSRAKEILSSLVDKNVLYIEGNGPSAKYKRK